MRFGLCLLLAGLAVGVVPAQETPHGDPPAVTMPAVARDLPPLEENAAMVGIAPRAEPSPVPAAEPLPSISFRSPLSLNDCINLLGAAAATLPKEPGQKSTYTGDSYLRLLESVSNYLKDRDDLHFTWAGYEWRDVARKRVTGGLIEHVKVTFDERELPRRVTAISFVIENEDVYLHSLKVYDYETTQRVTELTDDDAVFTHQFDQPIIMRHSLPKLTFFHLLKPTDIGMIEMAVSQLNPESRKTPRIIVRMGRTNNPEHVKLAIWEIIQAQKAMKADQFPQARERMDSAQTQIRLLRNALRLTEKP